MKFLRQGIALAVLGAGLAAAPGLSASASPAQAPDDKSMVQQMRSGADGSTIISKEDATGQVGFIRASAKGDLLPNVNRKPAAKADAYMDKYASAFGAPRKELVRDSVTKSNGDTTINYVQEFKGLPVFGSLLRAHVDSNGDLTSVNGEVVPDIDVGVDPAFSEAEAGARAVRNVKAHPPGDDGKADTSGLKTVDAELMVYRTGLVKGTKGTNQLVWRVEVTNGTNIRDMVFVSAEYGKPVNRYSMIDNALDRVLFEADEDRNLTQVWEEGDDLPGDLNSDQESMVRSTGEAYWFFRNAFDRDSYDGEGAKMLTINNDPAIQCPNANWNGQTTNYCDGVSSDDVVAHEWGHAYTEYTHALVYQWQAGALNESYSDIWGETVDLINGRLDEDEGNLNLTRPVGLCSSHTRGGIGVTINSPADVAGPCAGAAAASFGPTFDKEGVTTDVVVAEDAENADGPEATDGCSPFENADAVSGKWAYVDRGTCAFTTKVANAEAAGATGIIFGNNVDGAPVSVSGESDLYGAMVTKADGVKFKSAGSLNVTVKDTDAADKADSYRWLIGEKSNAFGGAIRDMWNPTCYGDPGKVTDAEYHCDTSDNGGVHGNSAVPNHGYSLLVDGGSYNGTTVKGIGLTKAANIYFKAMNEYQTPVSDFTDHANSLEAACADLTAKRINKLSTKEDDSTPSNDKITTSDCAQVAAMTKAVELRTEPVQCNFEPLLPDKAGSPCGEGFDSRAVFSEKFEEGFGEWTQEEELGEGAARGFDWEASFNAPDHDNGVAFAPDPSEGDCIPGSDDISSANSLISPEITVPEDGVQPVVSFDHYVATESGWDGGAVRVKVNDGEFTVAPADAYLANGPNMVMETAAAGNTSPLAGVEGFSGTDGGELHGSWGTSQIDLTKLDVVAGDTVQVEFAMGRDGCNGFDGWYVDNVELTVCDEAPAVKSTTRVLGAPIIAKRRGAVPVKVKVSAKGTTPTGRVALYKGTKKVAQGHLNHGRVKLKVLRRNLHRGANHLRAKYSGSKTVNPSRKTFVIGARWW
ncbi:MAG: M4 family metallopeptidase [Nocardioides sp.]|nr:M4 family metallopeptidase [Nocardioides sp.]